MGSLRDEMRLMSAMLLAFDPIVLGHEVTHRPRKQQRVIEANWTMTATERGTCNTAVTFSKQG
jgi:hypothetical protein